MDTVLCIAMGCTLFLLLSTAATFYALRPSQSARRILALVRSQRPDRRVVRPAERLQEHALAFAKGVRARLGLAENDRLKRTIEAAGLRDPRSRDLFFATRTGLPLAALLGALFAGEHRVLCAMCLPAVGYLLPGLWLKRRTSRRRNKVRRGLPDALDLLGICVDAGLGLDQALLRVGTDLSLSHPEINEELTQVNLEQRAGRARLDAWTGLAERTQIDEFKSFASMLMQADRFGTPIGKALNAFSDDLRLKRRQSAEEAAAKTKIKIIFPLVLFIFPCVFIVLLGPALMSIASGLAGMTR